MTVKIVKNVNILTQLRYVAMECTMEFKLMMTLTKCNMIITKKDIGVIFKFLMVQKILTVLIQLRMNIWLIMYLKKINHHQLQELLFHFLFSFL